MNAAIQIRGRKAGASSAHTPVETPDSLQSTAYAKLLLALGEGEFAGGLTGQDIYLDGTPLLTDGSENFPGVTWDFRPGTVEQEHIAGMPSVENEIAVGVELRSDTPWVRAVTDTQLSAVRIRLGWPALQQQKDNGDIVGYAIDYAIDLATDGGAYQQVATYTLSGKTTSLYERTHRIDLPASSSGWQVRVRRLTGNQDNNRIADTMRVQAITEVVDAKLRYPNTALLFVQFDASQFQNIPQVAADVRGRKVRVPGNYDPVSRTYTGVWDGAFQWAWTDNPAWIWYDMVLSERFGLGRRIDQSQVDKWNLYEIAQYCDQLVSDGQGGLEPRFTCNVYFQSRAEAWTVLRDLSAIFRGLSYWADSQMFAMADMPRDIDYVYTRANAIDGRFVYASASEKSRHTMALVSYDDPDNGYQSAVEVASDPALVRRYGVNQVELTAIGCTRRSEANRRGRWALLTNSRDRTVEFSVGLDGQIPLPGRIIGVADELLAGRPLGGRISAVAGRTITLDRDAQVATGDRLVLNLPSGVAEGRTVESVAGRAVTVTTDYSEVPVAQAVWSIDAADLAIQQYRVTGISEPQPGIYKITGIQHDPGKYALVDSGARLEARPISVVPPSVQSAPTGITVDSYTSIDQGLAVTTLRAQWVAAPNAVAYEAEWRKDSGQWISVPRTTALGFEVPGIYAGRYLVRVRAINALDVASLPASSAETQLNGKEGAPPAVSALTTTAQVFGIRLDWAFPAGAEDTQRTEIRSNATPVEEGAQHLGDYAYPLNTNTLTGLSAGVTRYFQARLVDRTGNIGPWSDWVMGQSSADATEILGYLGGEISETELAQGLAQRIDLIDAAASVPGSVNARVADAKSTAQAALDSAVSTLNQALADQEALLTGDVDGSVTQRLAAQRAQVQTAIDTAQSTAQGYTDDQLASLQTTLAAADAALQSQVDSQSATAQQLSQQIAALNSQVADIIGAAAYDVGTAYAAGDLVTDAGTGLYRAKQAVPAGTPLTDTAYWDKVGDYSSIGDAVVNLAAQVSALDTRVTATESGLQAEVDKTDLMATQVAENQAAISAEAAARAAGDGAEASQRQTLAAVLTGQADPTLSLDQLDGPSLVLDFASLTYQVYQPTGIDGLTSGLLYQERQARVSQDAALATQIETLSASVQDNLGLIQSEQIARADADTALGQRIDQVSATAGDNATAISQEATARADADTALGQRIDTLSATVDDNLASLNSEQTARANADTALGQRIDSTVASVEENVAALTAEQQARASGDEALASDISSLTTQVDANLAAVSAESTARATADAAEATQRQTLAAVLTGQQNPALTLADVEGPSLVLDFAAGAYQVFAPTAAELLTSGLLYQERQARVAQDQVIIQQVETLAATVGENTAAINTEQTARANADTALGQQIETVAAAVGDNTAAITAEQQARANADAALSQQIDTLSATVDENTAAIAQEATARADAISTEATQREQLSTALIGTTDLSETLDQLSGPSLVLDFAGQSYQAWGPLSSGAVSGGVLATEQKARADADSALSQQLTQLGADFDSNSASVDQLLQTLSSEQQAQASEIEQLTTEMAGKASAAALESLQTTVTQQGDSLTAVSQSVEQLSSAVQDNASAITSESSARANETGALSERLDTVQATVSADNLLQNPEFALDTSGWVAEPGASSTVGRETNALAILSPGVMAITQSDAVADTVSVVRQRIFVEPGLVYQASAYTGAYQCWLTVDLMFYDQGGNVLLDGPNAANNGDGGGGQTEADWQRIYVNTTAPAGAAYADFRIVKYGTTAGADSVARFTRALCCVVDSEQAALVPYRRSYSAVQQSFKAVNGISASWMLRTDVNGRVAGMGLENDGYTSAIGFRTDMFYISDPDSTSDVYPFVFTNGQLFLNSAVISQADIINLIVTGTLQSKDYVPGQSGIRINFVTSEFEMNGSVSGKGRMMINNRALKFWDANNVLRAQFGDLEA